MPISAHLGRIISGIRGLVGRAECKKSVPPATFSSSTPRDPIQAPPANPPSPPSPGPPEAPRLRPPGHYDEERCLCSASTDTASTSSEEGKKDQGTKPFHERMSECATSIAGCLVALPFVLLLKAPSAGFPPALLCIYCYFAMLNLFTGVCIYCLHVARAPNRDLARIQAIAAAIGLAATVMDGVVLCYFLLEPPQFWALALALVTSTVGFCGVAVTVSCRKAGGLKPEVCSVKR